MKSLSLTRRHLLQLGAGLAASPFDVEVRAARAADSGVSPLTTKGIWMHAWDLRDHGPDHVMGWIQDSGLNQMCIASCYHSGWFVHPKSPKRRCYLTEGSVAYFQPDEKLYSHTPIRPQVASFAKETNWLAVAGERLQKYNLRLVAWALGAHNTTLGLLYPQYTQQNVYGDSIPHALSIGHDATREYLKALCRDLAVNYPTDAISLEAFDWQGFRHGHHHERDLVGLTPLEQALMALCFNPQTVQKARATGIDVTRVQEVVKAVLDDAFREAPGRPQGHPRTMAELEARSTELKAYNRFRQHLADSLLLDIKQQALKGTSCKLWLGGYQKEQAEVGGGFMAPVDVDHPERVFDQVKLARASLPKDWSGDFFFQVNLRSGSPASESQLREIVLAARQGGSTGPVFYNYSESPPKMLGWIKTALAGL